MILQAIIGIISIINMIAPVDVSSETTNKRAIAELKSVLFHRQKFIKAHAAEYLIWTGHADIALNEYLNEEDLYGSEPKYRVVIWRVLNQAENDTNRKAQWLSKICAAYTDMAGPDRTHATETLAKLKQPVVELFPEATAQTLASIDRNLQTYALWASSYGSSVRMNENREKFVQMALADNNTTVRKISAFILRKEQGLSLSQWDSIASAALTTVKSDEMYVAYLTTAIVTAPEGVDAAKISQVKAMLIDGISTYNVNQRMELALALAEKGNREHLPLLNSLLDDKDSAGMYDPASDEAADMRAAVAYAILKINSKN
jgi:HEAT repeat protein